MAAVNLKITADSAPMMIGMAGGLRAVADTYSGLSAAYLSQAEALEVKAYGHHKYEYGDGRDCRVCGFGPRHSAHDKH